MAAKWIVALLTVTVDVLLWGQTPPEGSFPLTTHLVARALCESGVQTSDEQVVLAATVVANKPDPALDILSVESIGGGRTTENPQPRSRVKMACHSPGTCLPFYAIVNSPQGAPTSPAAVRATATAPSNLVFGSAKAKSDITMRAGTHAILMMDDQRSHIQITVISLENGSAGKWIHVASPDHKQIYLGEVVSPSLLRGNF